jgi:putative DNA primase/helicase
VIFGDIAEMCIKLFFVFFHFRTLTERTRSKRFLTDGAIKGNFIPVQGHHAHGVKLLICEGFATGASLAHAYPKACVIAACNAGNLKPVAVTIRKQLPQAKIIICADDDRLNTNNPGINKGREAAIASGSLFVKPNWPDGAPTHLTDFNDLVCWQSNREVAA